MDVGGEDVQQWAMLELPRPQVACGFGGDKEHEQLLSTGRGQPWQSSVVGVLEAAAESLEWPRAPLSADAPTKRLVEAPHLKPLGVS